MMILSVSTNTGGYVITVSRPWRHVRSHGIHIGLQNRSYEEQISYTDHLWISITYSRLSLKCCSLTLRQTALSTKGKRTGGGLTGSRTAGILGRILVESIVAERVSLWRSWGFHANRDVFCLCTLVDNLFSASDSIDGAISILEDFEYELKSKWGMAIKESSRSCMPAAGHCSVASSPKWPIVDCFLVLGHCIQHNGSIRSCWSCTRSAMWRAFWGNAGSKTAECLSRQQKMCLIARAVSPQVDYRSSRWPPQSQIAQELDKIHQKMISIVLHESRKPGEDIPEYVRRRGRIARNLCEQFGFWSQRWFARAIKWDRHLSRTQNASSWLSRLHTYHASEWLIGQRLSFIVSQSSTTSMFAGRTGTRSFQGNVFMRWHDGIHYALDNVSEEQLNKTVSSHA